MPTSPPIRWAPGSSSACRSEPVPAHGDGSAPAEKVIHASCVAHRGRAALIRGASGSGKSGLALQLMAMGAELVADDRTRIRRDGGQLMADAPAPIRNRIEARGVGILAAPACRPQPVGVIVDLDVTETLRLPADHRQSLLGVELPAIRKSDMPHFPAAILLYLAHGRID